MPLHGLPLRTRARHAIVRAGAALAVICLLGVLLALAAGGFGTAQAKKGGGGLPPGKAGKQQSGATSQQAGDADRQGGSEETTKTAKPQKTAKPPRTAKPPKAHGSKKSAPLEGDPSPSDPPASQPEPTPAPGSPAATPKSPGSRRRARSKAPRRESAAQGQRKGVAAHGAVPGSLFGRSVTAAPAACPAGAGSACAERAAARGAEDAAAAGSGRGREQGERDDSEEGGSPVTSTVNDIVEVVPDSVKFALSALAALSFMLGGGYLFSALRARSLARQRRELLRDVGLLQGALLPPVPDKLGALRTSVAYRPADGPGAGGDFYDALPLPGDRAAFILGDVSGHGRAALERTAFMRYTLRAYLEAGLEPRMAVHVAGRVIDESLGSDFATVLLAVHDPGSGSLTYASAGHPAPIVIGGGSFQPVLVASSPPIGVGLRTGLRQTTVPLVPGSVACLYTDGLAEARTDRGILGRYRLERILAGLGPEATASQLIERVADEARIASDDMATCLLSPTAGVTAGGFRTEQLELSAQELEGPLPGRFLEACGVTREGRAAAELEAQAMAERSGGAVLTVAFGNRRTVEVLPHNVESIEAASQRVAAR